MTMHLPPLVQIAPTTGTVVAGVSAAYFNQLKMMGAVGPVTYAVTLPESALQVFPDGSITTTGLLEADQYQISGIATDDTGNTGPWMFTLTVVGAVSPETAVTPVQPVLPNQLEILVPFQIDAATGRVAILNNYAQILEQHIETIIMTQEGERVMMPTYGYGLEKQVFAPEDQVVTFTGADIMAQLQQWEPAVKILSVTLSDNPNSPNQVTVTVEFTVVPFGSVNTVSVSTGGSIAQIVSI